MTSYEDLKQGSLFGAKVENGLQTSAIYWELNLNSYNGLFGASTYGQKWTWKCVDDQIRSFLGMDNDVANDAFVYHGSRSYFREYDGHRDVYRIKPGEKRFNFSFFPTNSRNPYTALAATTGPASA